MAAPLMAALRRQWPAVEPQVWASPLAAASAAGVEVLLGQRQREAPVAAVLQVVALVPHCCCREAVAARKGEAPAVLRQALRLALAGLV